MQESVGDEALCGTVTLPAAADRLTREVALGGIGVDRDYCRQVQAEGVTEGAYVEIVSVVSRLVNLDVFARGIGVPSLPFREPVEDGAPSFERPAEAIDEGFFVPSVPSAPAGGALAESLYGKEPAGNIMRTVSLVPDEARRVLRLIGQQYLRGQQFMSLTWDSV